jgi:hypothetical protein
MQPEARFKKHLRTGFSAVMQHMPHYWLPLVASLMQKSGIPDLYVADGKIGAWIEAKVNGNGLSPLQALEQRKMAMAGSICIVVHTDLSHPEPIRGIDWSRFKSNGDMEHIPSFVRWIDNETPEFWKAIIHGP